MFIYLPLILFTKVVLLRGRHAIEGWGCRHGVCTHVPEEEPVSHPELGEGAVLQNTVQSITGWSPNAATVTPFVTFLFVIMNKKRAWFIEITQFFPLEKLFISYIFNLFHLFEKIYYKNIQFYKKHIWFLYYLKFCWHKFWRQRGI